jgi:tRNA (guanine-N(7)-)-methyltransferase subunit TRM82
VEDAPLEPPNKRRKVEQIEEDSNIINITPTPDGRHAVVVTAEDKNLRVFSVSDEGRLEQLSQR